MRGVKMALFYGSLALASLAIIGLIFALSIVGEKESEGVRVAKDAALNADINAADALKLTKANQKTIVEINARLDAYKISMDTMQNNHDKLYDEVGPLIHLREKFQALYDKYNDLNERISKKRPVLTDMRKPAELPKGKGLNSLFEKAQGKKAKAVSQ